MQDLIQSLNTPELMHRLLNSLIVVVIAIVLTLLIRKLLSPKKMDMLSGDSKRAKTYIHLLTNTITTVVAILAILMILSIFGIDIKGYAAGLGVVGIVVGFALQDYLGDIVKGIELVIDGAFELDDILVINGKECVVRAFNLRQTTLYCISTGSDIVLYNSQISTIEHICDYVDVPVLIGWEVPYSEGCRRVREVIPEIEKLRDAHYVEYVAPARTTDASIEYRVRIHGNMANKYVLVREANDIILKHFEENQYEVGCENRYEIKK